MGTKIYGGMNEYEWLTLRLYSITIIWIAIADKKYVEAIQHVESIIFGIFGVKG